MAYRDIPVQVSLAITEALASVTGSKLKVELSDHSIDIDYVSPDKDTRAWDLNLYRNGNVFVRGYANPVKPEVDHNEQLENPDTIDVQEGDTESELAENAAADKHVSLISSSRYRDYMRQDLVSQLLTPQEQWKLIAYGVLGLGILQFIAMVITLYGTGSF